MGYTKSQIVLHWTVMALVALQFLLNEGISTAFRDAVRGGETGFTPLVALHVFLGFLVFAFTLWRLALRLTHGAPPPPEAEPEKLRKLSDLAHWAFYVLLAIIPVSGAVAWFRLNRSAADAHEVLTTALLALIVLHVAAVAVHQFVWKTNLIDRMRRPAPRD
ncbi:cytochrome b [Thetidibacter halocola]|uniref:Cytochrome b/b6 domain-containing protein n=1 Tax=Thetidibacter halocola TaxID=2827239 RepID=A0A8J8B8J0_9RHOB|nr:cytochrome b/b6 domain-containing protein [Thetidibacter halocola]MBS0124605.1 cytochrome b/b6 domain-containing protein [Thetidibacter halocola]